MADLRVYDANGQLKITSSGGGPVSPWQDTSGVVNLVTAAGNVTIGSATAGGKLFVDGDADEIQVQIQQHSTQAANPLEVQNSSGAVLVALTPGGGAVFNEQGAAVDFRIEGDTNQNLFVAAGSADGIGMGTATPNAAALLELASTTKGLLVPRLTTTERDAISSPPNGLVLYNSTLNKLQSRENGAWVSAGGSSASVPPSLADVRLSLAVFEPVSLNDVTASSVLLYPYRGNRISLYESGAWVEKIISATISAGGSIPATTNTNYDVFVYDNAGTLTLDLVAWSSDTARATALVRQDGVYVKSGATARRYVGTLRTNGTSGQTEDSAAKRFLWNYYNRVLRKMLSADEPANTYAYTTAAWREQNANTANRLEFVIGVAEDTVRARNIGEGSTTTAAFHIGVGEDSTTVNSADRMGGVNNAGGVSLIAEYSSPMSAGYHYLAALEYGGTGVTMQGDNNIPDRVQAGIIGEIWA